MYAILAEKTAVKAKKKKKIKRRRPSLYFQSAVISRETLYKGTLKISLPESWTRHVFSKAGKKKNAWFSMLGGGVVWDTGNFFGYGGRRVPVIKISSVTCIRESGVKKKPHVLGRASILYSKMCLPQKKKKKSCS